MTRTQYAKVIERELQALNERIDLKILRGERYTEESRLHKALLQKIRKQRVRAVTHGRGLFASLFSF